jgi:hypothetical protein
MISKEIMTKIIDLELPDGLKKSEKKELLKEIGDYVVVSMLDYIGEGKSPVSNARDFKKLTPKYADAEKGGDRLSNMDLEGDMLDALTYKIVKDQLQVGWFNGDQAIKAYGHTTGMEGHPWLEGKAPIRKLLPDEDENFKRDIVAGINEIISEFLDANQD